MNTIIFAVGWLALSGEAEGMRVISRTIGMVAALLFGLRGSERVISLQRPSGATRIAYENNTAHGQRPKRDGTASQRTDPRFPKSIRLFRVARFYRHALSS